LIGTTIGWAEANKYASKQIGDWISKMIPFMESQKETSELLRLENDLVINKSIPALKNIIELYREKRKVLSENLDLPALEWQKQMNQLTEKQAGYEKELADAIKKEADERKKATDEQIKYIIATTPMPTFGAKAGFGKGKEIPFATRMLFGEGKIFEFQVFDRFSEAEKIIRKGMEDTTNESIKNLEKQLTATRHFTSQIGNAFASSFMGINNAWEQMIQNMLNELLSAGFESLILSLFKGGSWDGWFSNILGFQQGLSYVPRTMPVVVHEGERILTRQENINYNYNSGGNSQTINVINLDPEKLTKKSVIPVIEQERKYRRFR
jgi:hypothetical protein